MYLKYGLVFYSIVTSQLSILIDFQRNHNFASPLFSQCISSLFSTIFLNHQPTGIFPVMAGVFLSCRKDFIWWPVHIFKPIIVWCVFTTETFSLSITSSYQLFTWLSFAIRQMSQSDISPCQSSWNLRWPFSILIFDITLLYYVMLSSDLNQL